MQHCAGRRTTPPTTGTQSRWPLWIRPRHRPPPRRPWTTTPSSSAPASPACTSSTACASWACGSACSRPAPVSAAPGTGTAIPAHASIRKAIPTATPSRRELLQEWNWSEHFSAQPETLRYLNYVADKFDLRRDIQFRSRVTAAHYQDATRHWDVTLEDGSRHTARFLITAIGPLSAPTMPRIEGVETFQGQSCHTARWPHEPVSFEGKRVGGDRHRRHRRADHPGSGQDRRPPDGVPAHAELVRPAAQQQDRRRDHGLDQDALSGDLPPLRRDLRLLPAHARPARHVRGIAGGTRGLLGEAVRRARLRHLAGQFPRHPDQPGGQHAAQRLRGPEDPPAGEEPGRGGKADPEEPRLRHPARAAGDPLLRGLQPAQRANWSTSTKPRSSASRPPASRPARPSTTSTSSSMPPASTRSPAASTASTSAGWAAGA